MCRSRGSGLSQADDEHLLHVPHDQNRVFVTRDRDFGNLVFVKGLGATALYLRVLPSTQKAVHRELERVLDICAEGELATAFVVVEPDGHRIRRVTCAGHVGVGGSL